MAGRRGIDDKVLDALTTAELAYFDGNQDAGDEATNRAYARLHRLGYNVHDSVLEVQRVRTTARQAAEEQLVAAFELDLASLGHIDEPVTYCPDPIGHDALEHDAAQEHRPAPVVVIGYCPWCGKPYIPGGTA